MTPKPKTLIFLLLTYILRIGEAFSDSEIPDPRVLSSPRTTDLGDWGKWETCPNGTFVIGMKLKTEPFQGPLDDTGLNGIQLLCGEIDGNQQTIQRSTIQSLVGKWGSWGLEYECPKGFAIGFQLRSEPLQDNGDNTAANNVRIYCSGTKGYLEGSGLWGTWTNIKLCPWDHVLCGLRTQVQLPQGRKHDDTSLNNVDMKCCKKMHT